MIKKSQRRLQSAFRKRQKSRQIKVASRKASAPGGIFQAPQRVNAATLLFASVLSGALRQDARNIIDHCARRAVNNGFQRGE